MHKIATILAALLFTVAAAAGPALAGKGNGVTPGGHGGGGFGESEVQKGNNDNNPAKDGNPSGINGNQGNTKSVGNAGGSCDSECGGDDDDLD